MNTPDPITDEDTERLVLYEVDRGVALITLNRPHRLNALRRPMRMRFLELVLQAGADDDVRVVVITGAGRGFCAGADRDYLSTVDGSAVRGMAEESAAPLDVLMTIPKPVIAALNGATAGIGLAYAMMSDLRFVATDAKLTTAFAKLGLVAEGGLSWLLPRAVGMPRALDLLYSSRVFTGAEAVEMGLAQWAFPADEVLAEALAYARTLAANSPYSLAAMRRQLREDWDRTWQESFAVTRELVAESVNRAEFAAATQRPPTS